jgi:Holliday junction resolvasome RuvABC endonuclease subunit
MLLNLENVMSRLIEEKRPEVIVLAQNHFSHIKQNLLLTLAVAKMKAIAKRHGLPVEAYAPNTVRKAVCNDGNATKRQLAQVVAARYTELKAYLESNRKWRERYYQNIFDAIAVGLTYLAHNPKNDEWTNTNSTAGR